MGAATSMPTIFIVSPALVEPLAEDQLAGFVQHQQLVVVLLDGDVELLLGVHVVAFPQGVVLGLALLDWGLWMHWSICVCVCVCVRAAKSWVHVQTHVVPKGSGNQHLDTGPAMMLHGILVATPVPPFLASAR